MFGKIISQEEDWFRVLKSLGMTLTRKPAGHGPNQIRGRGGHAWMTPLFSRYSRCDASFMVFPHFPREYLKSEWPRWCVEQKVDGQRRFYQFGFTEKPNTKGHSGAPSCIFILAKPWIDACDELTRRFGQWPRPAAAYETRHCPVKVLYNHRRSGGTLEHADRMSFTRSVVVNQLRYIQKASKTRGGMIQYVPTNFCRWSFVGVVRRRRLWVSFIMLVSLTDVLLCPLSIVFPVFVGFLLLRIHGFF